MLQTVSRLVFSYVEEISSRSWTAGSGIGEFCPDSSVRDVKLWGFKKFGVDDYF